MGPRRTATGAVVIGGYVNGLDAVRSLGALGVPVAVIPTQGFDIAQHSRWATESHRITGFHRRPENLLDFLEARSSAWQGRLLIPSHDEGLELLARHRTHLERWYEVVAEPWEVTSSLLRKDRFHQIARAVGVPLPENFGPATVDTLEASALSYPLLVKPVESAPFAARFGRKLFVASNEQDLKQHISRIEDAGHACELHDWIPGADDHVYIHAVYMTEAGDPRGGVTVRKWRCSPPFFGVGRIAQVVEDPGLHEPTVEILRAIGYRGMASAEFKLDPRDGTFRALEINGRLSLMHAPARRAGFDFPGMAWQDYGLGTSIGVHPNGWDGMWIHLHADLLYGLLFRKVENLGSRAFWAPYRGRRAYAVWSARDPVPFAAQWGRSAIEAVTIPFRRSGLARIRERVEPMPGGGY